MKEEDHNQNNNQIITLAQLHNKRSKVCLPAFTILFYVSLIGLSVLEYYCSFYSLFFQSYFIRTLRHLQVWQLFISLFGDSNYFIVLIAIVTMPDIFGRFERVNSTVVLFYQLMAICVTIELVLFCIDGALWTFFQGFGISVVGFGGIWINFFYKVCYYETNSIKLIFGKYLEIKSHFVLYPILLLAWLLYITADQHRYDILIGFWLAVFECKFTKGGFLNYTMDTYTIRQEWGNFTKLSHTKWYINFKVQQYKKNRIGSLNHDGFFKRMSADIQLPQQQFTPEYVSAQIELGRQ